MKFPAPLAFVLTVLSPLWVHGASVRTAETERSALIPASAAATDPSSRAADLRIKQAELDGLELSRKTLLETIATREAEKASLQAKANQEWEKARLPITTKLLDDSKAALATVESQLKTVRQELDGLQKTGSALQPPSVGVITAITSTQKIVPPVDSGMEAQLAELRKQQTAHQAALNALLAKVRASGSKKPDPLTAVSSKLMEDADTMIELRSLIAQQAAMIQMVTGMQQSLAESQKAIIGNIGR